MKDDFFRCSPTQLASLAHVLDMCDFKPHAQLEVEAVVRDAAAKNQLGSGAGSAMGEGQPLEAGRAVLVAAPEQVESMSVQGGGRYNSPTALSNSSNSNTLTNSSDSTTLADGSSSTRSSSEAAAATEDGSGEGALEAALAALHEPSSGSAGGESSSTNTDSADGPASSSSPQQHLNSTPSQPAPRSFDGQCFFSALLLEGRLGRCRDGEEVMSILGPLAAVYVLPKQEVLQVCDGVHFLCTMSLKQARWLQVCDGVHLICSILEASTVAACSKTWKRGSCCTVSLGVQACADNKLSLRRLCLMAIA
jgi:hypothetical protein